MLLADINVVDKILVIAPMFISETVLHTFNLLSLFLQVFLAGACGQMVAAATEAYSLSGAVLPLGLDPKMLPLKALEVRQAVLLVARLSGF